MAKDVDLVVRMRNEASKAAEAISAALAGLVTTQDKVADSAAKTDNVLSALKQEFIDLNRQANNLQSLGRVATALDKAGEAVKRLETNIEKGTADLGTLTTAATEAAAAQERLSALSKAGVSGLDAQREAIKKTREELRNETADVARLERELKRLSDTAERTTQPKSSVAQLSTDKVRGAVNLRNELPGSSAKQSAQVFIEAQLREARDREAGSQARLNVQQASLAANIEAQKAIQAAAGAASEKQRTLDRAVEGATDALTRQQTQLGRAREGLQEIEQAAQAASTALGGLAATENTVAAAAARVAASQAQARARIDVLSGRQTPIAAADDERGLTRQKLEARRDYVETTDQVKQLARALREAEQPTEAMGRALGEAQAKARLAKQQYQELSEALNRVKQAQGGTATSQGTFAAFSARIAAPTPQAAATTDTAPDIAPIKAAGEASRQTGAAMREGAAGAASFRDALKGIYGDSRESLSLMQRLRGEVLALTASYVGFQTALNGIRFVVDTFRSLEAAQSRLGAVFNQNNQRVGAEISFLQREAQRLGIQFSTLADEYGKFTIAAQAANFTSQDTRKIFMSVAEAARVNKLSGEQVTGVFRALGQMISKGTVQSEELKGQLGDRLPGAVTIFASALDRSVYELERMLQAGEVLANSENLLKFADELNKRFGPQLAASLLSTTTEIGRFQNSLQNAALQVANGGLIDGFTTLLRTLNEYFASTEGQKFFLSLGAAAQRFFEAVAAIVPYLDQIRIAIGALIAFKFAQAFVALGVALRANIAELRGAAVSTDALTGAQARLAATSAALSRELTLMQVGLALSGDVAGVAGARYTVAAAALGAFRAVVTTTIAALRGLLAAFGGVAGIVVTGLTIAAGYWLTSVESTTDALADHKRLIDAVVTGYEQAKQKTDKWADSLKGASKVELTVEIEKAQAELEKTRRAIRAPVTAVDNFAGGIDFAAVNQRLEDVVSKFKRGELTANELKKAIDEIAQADPGLDKGMLTQIIKSAEQSDNLKESVDKLKAALALMKGEATDAQKRLLGLSEALNDTGAKKAAADMVAFKDAMNDLKNGIPALAVELRKAKEMADAFAAASKAVAAASGDVKLIQEATDAYSLKVGQINDDAIKGYIKQFGGDRIPLKLFQTIFGEEGFRSQAYRDQGGMPTIGYGSTRINGRAVQMGDVVDAQGAIKQAVDDLNKFGAMVDAATNNAKLSENQRNALVSYVYNVGNTDGSAQTRAIFEAIRQNRPDQEVANLIASGVATVNGQPSAALRERRRREAGTYLTPDDRLNGQDSGATNYERDKARLDAQRRGDEEIAKQVEKANRNAADQRKINEAENQTAARREVAIQTAVIEAQNKARDEGRTITKEQLEAIRASTAAEYDQLRVNDQAKEAEEKVDQLYKLRKQLLEELKVAREQGDLTQITATRKGLNEVNEKTREAIALAIKYWQAVGGTEADTAISKLKIMGAQTEKNKTEILTAGQANEKLAAVMTRAFDSATEGIGKAIAGTGSWKEAIRGVGVAFLQFAADFLREIGNMILKQLLLNALQGFMGGKGGGVGGFISSGVNALVGTGHTGGIVGSGLIGVGNSTRLVDPGWFAKATRYHTGGFPGLRPNEVPAILQRNEEVLAASDPRNALNGGRAPAFGGGVNSIKSVLVMDPNMIPDAMSATPGERVVMSHIKANRETIKQMLRY